MAADVSVMRLTGSGPTETPVEGTNIRFRMDDEVASEGSGSALPKPSTGNVTYSYWVSLQLNVTGGSYGVLNNIVVFTDGASSHPVGVFTVGDRATAYVEADGSELNTTNHADLVGDPGDVFYFTSGDPRLLPGSITSPSTGAVGGLFVMQVQVDEAATGGTIDQETLTFQWDET